MKYLEELKSGDIFTFNSSRFILTTDYKLSSDSAKKRMCIQIENGNINWLKDDTIVSGLDLYYRDSEGNILALKEIKNEYSDQTKDIR